MPPPLTPCSTRSPCCCLSVAQQLKSTTETTPRRGRKGQISFPAALVAPCVPTLPLSLPFVSRGAYPIPSANLMLGFLRKIGDIQGLFMRRAVARAVVRPTNFIRVQMACYASTATAAAAAAAVLGVLGYLGLSSPRLGYDRPRRPCDHHRKACCLEFCTRSLCGITGELYNEI